MMIIRVKEIIFEMFVRKFLYSFQIASYDMMSENACQTTVKAYLGYKTYSNFL